MKSTHGTTKSAPTTPLMSPIFGSTLIVMPWCASAESPAELSRDATPWTTDQVSPVGPPGAAQLAMTSWATATEPALSAVESIAASWASAPCGVCG